MLNKLNKKQAKCLKFMANCKLFNLKNAFSIFLIIKASVDFV